MTEKDHGVLDRETFLMLLNNPQLLNTSLDDFLSEPVTLARFRCHKCEHVWKEIPVQSPTPPKWAKADCPKCGTRNMVWVNFEKLREEQEDP